MDFYPSKTNDRLNRRPFHGQIVGKFWMTVLAVLVLWGWRRRQLKALPYENH